MTTTKSVTLTFDWVYSNGTDTATWDQFVYYLNGTVNGILTSGTEGADSFEISLSPGDQFGLGIYNPSDACCGPGIVEISNINFAVNEPECPITDCFIRQFTATDECGNTTTANQFVTFIDTTPPVIDPQAMDMTVECDGQGNLQELEDWLNSNGGASATDNCSDVTWSNDFEALSDDCGETGSATVTFTATDECGNESTTTATFTIEDTTPPSIDVEAQDMTVECDGQGNLQELEDWLDNNGGASASDICSDLTWSNNFSGLSDDCGETGSATVEFTATDRCGNESKTTATFTIEDTTPPSIDEPAMDMTVECDGNGNLDDLQAWLDNNGGASASDICSGVTWSNNFSGLSDDCGETGSATVEFTATDDCGNESKTSATFTIEDTTPPTIEPEAQDMTVECDGNGNLQELEDWLNSNGGASASDICSGVTWSNNFGEVSDECGATGSVTVEFTATDDCGNDSKTTATFTIEDTIAPVLVGEVPPSINDINACYDEMPVPPTTDEIAALFEEACGEVVVSLFTSPVGDDCGWSVIHIYSVEDECGNPAPDVKVYYSGGDETDPELVGVPDDITIECDEDPGNPADVTATDNCDNDVEVGFNEETIPGDCPNNYTIVRTWTATDDCGNSVSDSQTITVQDTTPPVLIGELPTGENEIDACLPDGDYGPTEDEIAALFEDNCGNVNVLKTINLNGDDCKWIMDISYIVSDDCGNELDEFKLWYHGGDMSAPEPTGQCDDEAMIFYTSNGADCPSDAGISLEIGDSVTVNSDWYVAGINVQGGLAPCFIDECSDVNDLEFVVVDKTDDKSACSTTLTITF